MLKAYREGKDLYAIIATGVYKNTYWDNMEHYEDGSPNPDGKKRRNNCKQVLLGIMYGLGVPTMAERMEISVKDAQQIMDDFYKAFPSVKKWQDDTIADAKKNGYVKDLWGRKRRLPEIQVPKYDVKEANSKGTFNPILICTKEHTSEKVEKYKDLIKKALTSRDKKGEIADIMSKARKDGITIIDNSGKLVHAENQCVNARIQGCLSGDTFIQTKDGIVPIESMANKNTVIWDGKEWSDCVVLPSGKKQKCILTTGLGSKIICSPDHKFLTINNGKREFKKLSNLTYVDELVAEKGIDKISNIEITNEYIEMYDVCNTKNERYVANGLIVHNSAATMTKKAMIKLYNDDELKKLDFRLLIGVHDELIGECPEINKDKVAERMSYIMRTCVSDDVDVPFKCDADISKKWYSNDYSDVVRKEYHNYIEGDEKKGIPPMTEKDAFEKIVEEHSESLREELEEICLNEN